MPDQSYFGTVLILWDRSRGEGDMVPVNHDMKEHRQQKGRPGCPGMIRLLAVMALLLMPVAIQAASQAEILILHSYDPQLAWTRTQGDGIRSVLGASGRPVRIYEDFMDTKRFRSPEYLNRIRAMMQFKYGRISYDLIMVTDNNALNFILDVRSLIFEDTPVVFSGINYFKPEMLRGETRITGVSEDLSIRDVIRTAAGQFPGTREFVVIGSSNRNSEKDNVLRIGNIAPEFQDRYRFSYHIDQTLEQLEAFLPTLSKGQVILFGGMIVTDSGHLMTLPEKSRFLRDHSSVPIYSFWDHYIGHGIMGGKLISGFEQGAAAGKIALRILDGEDPDTITVIRRLANQWVFDYNELSRFNLSKNDLPQGCRVINLPPDRYRYMTLIAALAGFLLIEALIIFYLIINTRRLKGAKRILRLINETLEQRVAERTRDLEKILEQLTQSESKYRYLFENMPDGYIAAEMGGRILMANPTAAQLLGYDSVNELHQVNVVKDIYADPDDRRVILQKLKINKSAFLYRLRVKQKDGEVIHVEGNFRVREAEDNTPVVIEGVFRDITRQHHLENRLKQMASTDPLTGCLNRRAFFEQLEKAISRAKRYHQPLSLLAMDIDHFKSTNDTYGHPGGDAALQKFTLAVTDMLRTSDILGRLGGEEFAVILPVIDGDKAIEVAQRIRAAVAAMDIPHDGRTIRLTVSIGVTTLEVSGCDLSRILKDSDTALYEAKQQGRNRVVWRTGVLPAPDRG